MFINVYHVDFICLFNICKVFLLTYGFHEQNKNMEEIVFEVLPVTTTSYDEINEII